MIRNIRNARDEITRSICLHSELDKTFALIFSLTILNGTCDRLPKETLSFQMPHRSELVSCHMSATGIIFDLKRCAIHDGPGIRTTVFFKGCPLDCWWCHNPESRQIEPELLERTNNGNSERIFRAESDCIVGRVVTVDEVMQEVLKDVVFYDQSEGGVTFSGGEPLLQMPFLIELLKRCRKHGIHTAVDTCGYASAEDFASINGMVDLYLYDLKLMDDSAHVKYTGVSNRIILDNLKNVMKSGATVNVRIPMIPGITDTDENLDAIAEYISSFENVQVVSLLPYNTFGEDKLRRFSKTQRLKSLQTQQRSSLIKLGSKFTALGREIIIGG